MLMKVVDSVFQVYCKCGFNVVKLHCDEQFEHVVDGWRVQHVPIANVNYCNARENAPRTERNNGTVQE